MATPTTTISSISVASEAVVKTMARLSLVDGRSLRSCDAIVCLNIDSGTPTRISDIAYDAKSVRVFLVLHAAVVEPAFLQFSKTCHDGRVVINRGESLRCVGASRVAHTVSHCLRAVRVNLFSFSLLLCVLWGIRVYFTSPSPWYVLLNTQICRETQQTHCVFPTLLKSRKTSLQHLEDISHICWGRST